MRKFLMGVAFGIFLIGVGVKGLQAADPPEDTSGALSAPSGTDEPARADEPPPFLDEQDQPAGPEEPQRATVDKEDTLRGHDVIFLRNRVDLIERESLQLTEKLRFLEDRINSLDRQVDDLKRHH